MRKNADEDLSKDMSHLRENPWNLPEEDHNDIEPYYLTSSKKILILSDIHFPFQHNQALETALEYGYKKGVDTIVLNGDILDMYSVSRWEKDPRKRVGISHELDIARNFLKALRTNFTDAQIVFKEGNHEERMETYLRVKAPELLDTDEFSLEVLLRMNEIGGRYVKNKKIIKAGHLNIIHGHEFGRSVFSPVNPARGFYNRGKVNLIAGHNHQTSEHSEPNMNGKEISCWSTGCLCDLRPAYMPYNKWNHGGAIVKMYGDDFLVDNFKIIKGKIR
jgi:predicted phosphodiesterase